MSLDLLLMRHAKAGAAQAGQEDHERGLTDRGRRAARAMGQLLMEQDLVPSEVRVSSALRTQETARGVEGGLGVTVPKVVDRDLYLASMDMLLRCVQRAAAATKRLLIVAHNPGLEEWVQRLAGRPEPFPTATVAHVWSPALRWDDPALARRLELRALWRPRELDS